jgi:hypothetical protein
VKLTLWLAHPEIALGLLVVALVVGLWWQTERPR